MNLKNSVSIALFVVLNFLSTHSFAQTSVWKVSKGDNYFYLGGTIHLLSAEDHPLPEEFTAAYKDSEKLIFEIDMEESETSEAQQKVLALMTTQSPTTLSDNITKETYSTLEQFLKERKLPIKAFGAFHPWSAALTVTLLEYQRLGMMPKYGVETHFNGLAVTDKKALGSLETFDEQLSFLSSMEDIEPNEMVNYTLRDLEQLPELIKTMKDSWRKGELGPIEEIFNEMKAEYPDLYNSLMTKRNNNWMPTVTALNDDVKKEFVLGAVAV